MIAFRCVPCEKAWIPLLKIGDIQSIEMFEESELDPEIFINLERPSLDELSLIFHSQMDLACQHYYISLKLVIPDLLSRHQFGIRIC